jgi:hypothetical protein
LKIISWFSNESDAIKKNESEICNIYYDNLVCTPQKEIRKICSFLKRELHYSIAEIKKETIDINILSNRSDKVNDII